MSLARKQKNIYTVRRLDGVGSLAREEGLGGKSWQFADVLEDFTFPWIDGPVPRTEFRALWSDQYFYFLFDVSDSDLILAQSMDAKARVLGSDRVEVFFSTGLELSPYYGFEVDPRGDVLSYKAFYHHQFDWDWRCVGLKVIASQRPAGYVVEVAVPMEALRSMGCVHENEEGLYLIAGLFRAEFSGDGGCGHLENWISWIDPKTDLPDFHVSSAFGTLKLV